MVHPERRSIQVNKFIQFLYNPITWVVVLTFWFGIFTFTVRSLFITPLESEIYKELNRIEKKDEMEHIQMKNRIDWNFAEVQSHKQWCDISLTKLLDERPTDEKLGLILAPIKNELSGVRDELMQIKDILIKRGTKEGR